MSETNNTVIHTHIRPATPDDAHTIFELIVALAEYERLSHMLEVTPQKVHEQLFGAHPGAQAVIAEVVDAQGQTHKAGFALFFSNFSTFLCKPGLYLEDLFVLPQWRSHGIGKALLSHLASIAVERRYARFEWCVLNWNKPAIGFYEAAGAQVLDDWRICRVTGDALTALAQGQGKMD